MQKDGYIYILTNVRHTGALYWRYFLLERRFHEHQNHLIPSFPSKYRIHKFVCYEQHKRIEDAIACQKQLKGNSRVRKIAIINSQNPNWHDQNPRFDQKDGFEMAFSMMMVRPSAKFEFHQFRRVQVPPTPTRTLTGLDAVGFFDSFAVGLSKC